MSAHALVSGVLFRQPESRTSKNGKPFVTATLKVKAGADFIDWWKILVFSESLGAELMALRDGDALSAQGALKVENYERNGETKLSLTVFADAILALKQAPKQREKKPAPTASAPREIRAQSSRRRSARSAR